MVAHCSLFCGRREPLVCGLAGIATSPVIVRSGTQGCDAAISTMHMDCRVAALLAKAGLVTEIAAQLTLLAKTGFVTWID